MGPKRTVTKRDSKSNGETNVAKETKKQFQKSRKDNVATEVNDADVAENSDEESQKETVTDLDQIPDKKAKKGKAMIVAQELKYSDPDEVEETKDVQPKNEVPSKRGKRGKATEVESSEEKADIDNDGEPASSAMNVNGKSKRAKKVKNTEMEDKTESIENKVASDISNANEGQSQRPKRGKATVNYNESKDAEGKNANRMQSKRQKRKKISDELNEEDAGQGDLGDSEEKGNKKAIVPEEKAGKKKKANQKVSDNSAVNKNKAEPLAQAKQNEEDQDELGESSGDEVKPKKAKAGKSKTLPQKKKLAKGKKSLTDDEEEPDTGIKPKKIAESLAQEKQNEEDQEDLGESSGAEVKPKAGKAKTLPQKKKLAKGKKSLTDDEEELDTESLAQEKQSEDEEEENIKEDSEDEFKLKKGAKAGKAKSVPQKKIGKGKMTEEEGELEDSDSEDKSKKAKGSKSASAKVSQQKVVDVEHLDFSNHSTSSEGEKWNLKITSWNVNGIRSWLQKDGLKYLRRENPDIMCVQETKCADDKLPTEITNLDGYHCYWLSGDKDGYSGVGMLSKEKPIDIKYGIGMEKHDNEGRVITAEFEKFILVGTYIPNAGRGLVRLGYRQEFDVDFRNYLKKLDEKKPIVLCGDLNVAHQEIDLTNPKTNKKTAGFTVEEREGFTSLLEEGFVDSFRHLYPEEKNAYTFWSYMASARAKNVGWRLDYFVLSRRLIKNLCDNVIRKDVLGSDHCPVTLFLAV